MGSTSGQVATRMGDCLRTSEPSRDITNTKVNSAFRPSGVNKSSTPRPVWASLARIKAGSMHSPVSLFDFIWQLTLCSSAMGFP